MKRSREFILHLGAWILYAGNSVLTYPSEYLDRYGFGAIGMKQGTFYAVMSVAFYVNYLFLAPRFLATRRYGWYTLGLALLIPAMLGLNLLHALFLDWYFDAGRFFLDDRLEGMSYLVFQLALLLLVSTGARFTADWFRLQRLREEVTREKEKAELSLLRQQLSPHFLFNSLNNIYSLAVNHPREAPRAILMLADLMRGVLRSLADEEVAVEDEITQLRGYVDLKRLQYPDGVRFTVTGTPEDRRIAPMLLLPFVENAFKHGDLRLPGSAVDIRLELDDDGLRFSVENHRLHGSKDPTSGIGLQNVRRRLALLYPHRHSLDINEDGERYRVSLLLRLP